MNITGLPELKAYFLKFHALGAEMKESFTQIAKRPPRRRSDFEKMVQYMDTTINEQTAMITIMKHLSLSIRVDLVKEPDSIEKLALMILLNEIDKIEAPTAKLEKWEVVGDKMRKVS
jgi:hypothetical protein